MAFKYTKTLLNFSNINLNNGCKKGDYDNVIIYSKLPNGNYIVKIKKDDGLEGDNDAKNTLPSHLGAFILSNSG